MHNDWREDNAFSGPSLGARCGVNVFEAPPTSGGGSSSSSDATLKRFVHFFGAPADALGLDKREERPYRCRKVSCEYREHLIATIWSDTTHTGETEILSFHSIGRHLKTGDQAGNGGYLPCFRKRSSACHFELNSTYD